jgi:hypothetical protein
MRPGGRFNGQIIIGTNPPAQNCHDLTRYFYIDFSPAIFNKGHTKNGMLPGGFVFVGDVKKTICGCMPIKVLFCVGVSRIALLCMV